MSQFHSTIYLYHHLDYRNVYNTQNVCDPHNIICRLQLVEPPALSNHWPQSHATLWRWRHCTTKDGSFRQKQLDHLLRASHFWRPLRGLAWKPDSKTHVCSSFAFQDVLSMLRIPDLDICLQREQNSKICRLFYAAPPHLQVLWLWHENHFHFPNNYLNHQLKSFHQFLGSENSWKESMY